MNEYALVWMSAGNSYFKEEVIKDILQKVSKKFNHIIVMAPDEPAEHTFKALGYGGNDVKKKARLNANLLQNRAKRVITSFSPEEQAKFHVVEWIEEVIPNEEYKKEYHKMIELYHSNNQFRLDAQSATKSVLESKTSPSQDIHSGVEEAVHYLLKEFAFIVASLKIYQAKGITYVYHKQWSIYEKFISGFYDNQPKKELKFLLLH